MGAIGAKCEFNKLPNVIYLSQNNAAFVQEIKFNRLQIGDQGHVIPEIKGEGILLGQIPTYKEICFTTKS